MTWSEGVDTSRLSGPAPAPKAGAGPQRVGCIGKGSRPIRLRVAGVVAVLATLAAASHAEEGSTVSGLAGASLEELATTDVVYAAAKREQNLRSAPSWVTVVSGEAIREHDYRTLAEILRSVPGFYVTDDRNYGYVGVRGFGRPGDYNTRILLLVDGVRLNDNVYDMAPIGADFPLGVDLIERVEIVRGPAASLYGNSAFFAVVNVVTREARHLGRELALSAGSFGTRAVRATYGQRMSNGFELAVSGMVSRRHGLDYAFPDPADVDGTPVVAFDSDAEDRASFYFSASRRSLSLTAMHASRGKQVPTGAYGTLIGDPRTRTSDVRTLLGLTYDNRWQRGVDVDAHLQYGRYEYEGTYAYGPGPEGLFRDGAVGEWLGGDINVGLAIGKRQRLTVGAELRSDFRQDQYGGSLVPPVLNIDERESAARWGIYAQHEADVGGGVVLHAGVRHDHYEHFGGHTAPRFALVWSLSTDSTLKLLYGEGFRAANEYELHYYRNQDPHLRPETIRSFEAVLERRLTPRARLILSAFSNRIEDLITLRGDADGDLAFVNDESARSRGAEIAIEGEVARLQGRLSYTYAPSDDGAGSWLTNSPRHLAKLSVRAPLMTERLTAALDLQYASERKTLRDHHSPGSLLTNLALRAPQIAGPIDLTLSIRNALDGHHLDPASEEHWQDVIPQPGREVHLEVTWSF